MDNPQPNDVLCARGRISREHSGNQNLRVLLQKHMGAYSHASCRLQKSIIVSRIIDEITSQSPPGRFLRMDSQGKWYEASDGVAREKIGQGFRDLLDGKYKSSTKAKKRQREKMIQTIEINGCGLSPYGIASRSGTPTMSSEDQSLERMFQQANSQLLQRIKGSEIAGEPGVREETPAQQSWGNNCSNSSPNASF